MNQRLFIASVVGTLTGIQAAIVQDGPWTDYDWCEASDIGVCYENGVPTSTSRQRELDAAMGYDGDTSLDPSLWENNANVLKIKEYIPDAATWDDMFPKRNEIYTYEAFLQAAAKFPAFCGENNNTALNDLQTCGRELAALIAHLTQETGYNDPNQPMPVWQ